MENIYNILDENQTINDKPKQTTQRLTKVEYAKMMKEKRQYLFSMANDQTMKAVDNPSSFKLFLELQAKFDYTVTNTLLVMAQNPNATILKDFNHWRNVKRFVSKEAHGIEILEPGNEYQRRDGSIGVSYNPKKVYDLLDLTNQASPEINNVEYDLSELVSSVIYKSEYKPEVVRQDSQIPEDVYFDENTQVVYVKHGLKPIEMVNGLLREYCFVECYQQGIHRQDASVLAQSAGYVLSKKYHLEGYAIEFIKQSKPYFLNKDQKLVKRELENIQA